MIAAVLLTFLHVPIPQASAHAICKAVLQMRDVNIPPAPARPETNVAHASLVYRSDEFAGVIYITRSDVIWYQLGTTRAKVDPETEATVATILGHANDHQPTEFYRINARALQSLIANGSNITYCY